MVAGAEDIKYTRYDQAHVTTLIQRRRPDTPLALFRPHVLARTAQTFQRGFPGNVSYAVKANPAPAILEHLVASGIRAFDVASVPEMRAVRLVCPDARLHYHNPIRSRDEITEAMSLGVASWSVDRMSELEKLGTLPPDTEIAVRVSLGRGGGAYDFGSKFGAHPAAAVALLQRVAELGLTPALTFHPGTQCTDPASWADYIVACAKIAQRAGVRLAALNVGGGFPSAGDGQAELWQRIFAMIGNAVDMHCPDQPPRLWCEPGRAMVADALWLLLRVKARSEQVLYLNDGLYGALGEWRDMPIPGCQTVLSVNGHPIAGAKIPFNIFGPTCDSLDRVPGTWDLPAATDDGDYLLLTGAGAYSLALVTGFNGYGTHEIVNLDSFVEPAGQCRLAG